MLGVGFCCSRIATCLWNPECRRFPSQFLVLSSLFRIGGPEEENRVSGSLLRKGLRISDELMCAGDNPPFDTVEFPHHDGLFFNLEV